MNSAILRLIASLKSVSWPGLSISHTNLLQKSHAAGRGDAKLRQYSKKKKKKKQCTMHFSTDMNPRGVKRVN
jgi:hypothetical protein